MVCVSAFIAAHKVANILASVSAIVTVTQQSWQYSPDGLPRYKYVFPVPACAAICAFEMIAEDGTLIKAIAKEKTQAKDEHNAALQKGQMTGLVEHVTDDSTRMVAI